MEKEKDIDKSHDEILLAAFDDLKNRNC